MGPGQRLPPGTGFINQTLRLRATSWQFWPGPSAYSWAPNKRGHMKLSKLEIWNFRSIEYVQIDIENLRLFVVSSGIDDIAYW